jgi:hypothetical protein
LIWLASASAKTVTWLSMTRLPILSFSRPISWWTWTKACCRQVGEGWFPDLASVPRQAISMSIRQIMQSESIVCTVPDVRKAAAVQQTVEAEVTNRVPASILQTHPRCWLFLDQPAASLLSHRV